ncbi:MAG: type III secretion system chaperone [Chromatiales bacterium]|nr:type III secretion system chaperone [Chromatiales bacterium]
MSNKENFQSILKSFGAAINLPDLSLDEDQRCNLFFDEVPVSIELSPNEQYIYMYSYLGDAPMASSAGIAAKLLEANYTYNETERCTLGIQSVSRKVALICNERIKGMELSDFEQSLENFINVAEYWMRNMTAEPSTKGDDTSESDVDPSAVKV